jgi:hypothetical protein
LRYTLSQSGCIITASKSLPAFFLENNMTPDLSDAPPPARPRLPSVLAWPAWLRVLAVLPAVALLWLAVVWAQLEAAPW